MTGYDKDLIYQGEPPDGWQAREVEKRALQMVLWVISSSFEHYRKHWRNWDEYFDLYTNQPLKLRQNNRIRSNVPSGMVSEQVDTFVADLGAQIAKSRPITTVLPNEPSATDSANLLEAKIQYDFENWTPEMGYHPVLDQVLLNAGIFGTGPSKMLWESRIVMQMLNGVFNEEDGLPEMVPTPGFRGAICDPLFVHDVYPHPLKVWPDDPYGIVHLSYQSFDRLNALKGTVYNDNVSKIPDRRDVPTILGEYSDVYVAAQGDIYQKADQRVRMGWTADSRLEPDGVCVLECECMFRPEIDWTDNAGRKHKGSDPVRTIITVANGVVIRVSPSPLRDGMSIYQNCKLNHIPGQWYGIGLIQKNRPQIHVVDTVLNMWLQQVAQSINSPKVVIPEMLESGQSLDDAPGGLIRAKRGVTSADQVIFPIRKDSVYNDVVGIIRFMSDRASGVSAATDLKQGRVAGGETTATESNLAFNQASLRFKNALTWVGATFILPTARKTYVYNRDYLDMPFSFAVMGESGMHVKELQQSDFAANVKFAFLGPERIENKQVRIAQLENFLKVLTPLIPVWPEAAEAVKEVVVQLGDEFNVTNLDQLKKRLGYGNPAIGAVLEQGPTGGPAGMPNGPSRRVDKRMGSNQSPTNATQMAKSLGAMLGRGGGGVRA